jgi:RraA family protein
MVHKALDMATDGDVVVVDAGGDLTNAIVGELMAAYAQRRGIAGLVIHGAVRDSDTLKRSTFPVFASGATHRGPYKNGPGEINVPIAIAGMVIEPGDLIAGDGDGVICVPYDEVEQVLADAQAKQSAEQKQMAAIRCDSSDRSWVNRALTELGCGMPDA